jgi:hypothetical protein
MTVSAECFRKGKWHYDYGLRSQVREYRRFGTHCLLCPAVGRILSPRSLPNYTASHCSPECTTDPFPESEESTHHLKSHLATNLLFLFHLLLDLPSRRFLEVKRQRLACFRLVSTVHEARPAASSVLRRREETDWRLTSVSHSLVRSPLMRRR